mmetsp:Transcript_177006/g.561957  ORF Transcript_177006/g.561957 Transcript_177006/m.561957 type:complete len:213 (-) Transcript_177006:638-1276(-)
MTSSVCTNSPVTEQATASPASPGPAQTPGGRGSPRASLASLSSISAGERFGFSATGESFGAASPPPAGAAPPHAENWLEEEERRGLHLHGPEEPLQPLALETDIRLAGGLEGRREPGRPAHPESRRHAHRWDALDFPGTAGPLGAAQIWQRGLAPWQGCAGEPCEWSALRKGNGQRRCRGGSRRHLSLELPRLGAGLQAVSIGQLPQRHEEE